MCTIYLIRLTSLDELITQIDKKTEISYQYAIFQKSRLGTSILSDTSASFYKCLPQVKYLLELLTLANSGRNNFPLNVMCRPILDKH